ILVRVAWSASTLSRSAFGILAKASLVGAKTVMSWAVLSASTRFACLTAATRVDSSGLPDAAVATGTLAMAAKLPGFDGSVGTAAQPAPNSPVAVAGAIDGASAGAAEAAAAGSAAAGAGAGAAAAPQADRETAQTEAAVTTANFRACMRLFPPGNGFRCVDHRHGVRPIRLGDGS